jgi:2-oxoglutarate ferredoxin oxidoreductase subunit gamma
MSRKRSKLPKRNCEEILCAGFGGQGIMFMGKLLAQAGLMASKHVTWMPSYGAEVRGGTAYSMTKISDRNIANPIVTNPDMLIAMNKPSLLKYAGKLKPGGVLIVNRSLVDRMDKMGGVKVVSIPMTDIASKLGNVRCANMIAVGALAVHSKLISIRIVHAALKSVLKNKEDVFLLNKKAIDKGYKR